MERALPASRDLADAVLKAPTAEAALQRAADEFAALFGAAEISVEMNGRSVSAACGKQTCCASHDTVFGTVALHVSVPSENPLLPALTDLLALALHARLLNENANADALTGVHNRAALDRRLSGTVSAVALIDIDYFKAYNDAHGHPAGDAVLRRVAHAASASLSRAGDFFARYGGEEFAVVLEDAGVTEAIAACERIREAVRSLGIPHAAGKSGRVTISVGFAVARDGEPADAALARADIELYRAKASGRDRVCGERYTGRRGANRALAKAYVPLAGREDERARIGSALQKGGLVAITGAAGAGKTRLAFNAACSLASRYRAIAFADAWAAADTTDLLRRLQPVLLNGPDALAVLDGCEHLLEASSEAIAQLRSRGVAVIAVSRVPLGMPGETVVRLAGLDGAAAEQVFCAAAASAGAIAQGAAPVLQTLIRRLNGSPAALIAAATALASSSPQAVLEDVTQRTQTWERSTIESLVSDAFAALNGSTATLASASAFVGPFTAEDAAAVYPGANRAVDETVSDLQRLQTFGLVAYEGERWSIAPPIRDAVKEEAATADLRRAAEHDHLQWCMRRYESSLELHGSGESQTFINWIAPISMEVDAALQRGLAQPALTDAAMVLCGHAARFFYATSRFAEANRWCNAYLDTGRGDDASRMRILVSLARISYVQGRMHDLERYALQALSLCGDDPAPRSVILNYLGIAAKQRSETEAALEYFTGSRDCARAAGKRRSEAIAIASLGSVSMDLQVDFEAAYAQFSQAVPLMRELGDQLNAILMESNIVEVLACNGNAQRARALAGPLLNEARTLGSVPTLLLVLSTFMTASCESGDRDAAHAAAREAVDLVPRLDLEQYHSVTSIAARWAEMCGEYETALRLFVATEWLQVRDGNPILPIERYHANRSYAAMGAGAEAQRDALLSVRAMKDDDIIALCARAVA
ncbi:MAG TPA: GGDEF domain-containing protein [Candidatus Baltobacteraceae bacterium]|nr:GGDEF domain-containing protein [Candidatus Baltobacteraceae bacterium]